MVNMKTNVHLFVPNLIGEFRATNALQYLILMVKLCALTIFWFLTS